VQQNLMQADAKAVARELLTKEQYRCFRLLISKESAWNPKAQNPTSSAAGLGQLLSGTYKNLGMKHSTEAVPQTVAALAYIGRKYGSAGPCGAWRHFQKKNWY
jgi:membrane-bound lytic murein transglycosylase MltF